MSLTWRKFNFFEKPSDGDSSLDEGVVAVSGSKTDLFAISAQGEVSLSHAWCPFPPSHTPLWTQGMMHLESNRRQVARQVCSTLGSQSVLLTIYARHNTSCVVATGNLWVTLFRSFTRQRRASADLWSKNHTCAISMEIERSKELSIPRSSSSSTLGYTEEL